jgi:hypothetical protein
MSKHNPPFIFCYSVQRKLNGNAEKDKQEPEVGEAKEHEVNNTERQNTN